MHSANIKKQKNKILQKQYPNITVNRDNKMIFPKNYTIQLC